MLNPLCEFEKNKKGRPSKVDQQVVDTLKGMVEDRSNLANLSNVSSIPSSYGVSLTDMKHQLQDQLGVTISEGIL
jgi:hypothetical protein